MKKRDIRQLFCNETQSGEYDKNTFFIVDGWDFIDKIAKLCKRDFDDSVKWLFGDNVEWGFSDEYSLCSECFIAVIRTSPHCYDWKPDYYQNDCILACEECAQDYFEARIQSIQVAIEQNRQPHSLEDIFKLSSEWFKIPNIDSYGYEASWENGLHHGMNCDPLRQGKIIHAYTQDNKRLLDVCYLMYPSQFYVEWDTYIRHNPENDLAFEITTGLLDHISQEFQAKANFPYDIATLCEQALKAKGGNFRKIGFDPNTSEIQNTNYAAVEDMYPNLK